MPELGALLKDAIEDLGGGPDLIAIQRRARQRRRRNAVVSAAALVVVLAASVGLVVSRSRQPRENVTTSPRGAGVLDHFNLNGTSVTATDGAVWVVDLTSDTDAGTVSRVDPRTGRVDATVAVPHVGNATSA